MSHIPEDQAVRAGSLRLFSVSGINVFLHWSWAVIAFIEIRYRSSEYAHPFWNIAEYLSVFLIVLLHEFGHALACRSVGGKADTILLWPLGGIAFVRPPLRPGPMLWSIAAGPLVNVVLVPVLIIAYLAAQNVAPALSPDLGRFARHVAMINAGLLIFNMLPIYPLDGGQIVQSLLWFLMPYDRSLAIAAYLGLVATVAGFGLALYWGEVMLVVMAVFAASRCMQGIKLAQALRLQRKVDELERRGL